MELDPQVQQLLAMVKAMGAPEMHTLPVEMAREGLKSLASMRPAAEPIARVENRRVPGPLGEIPVRIYHPDPTRTLPGLVWFHGGGWVLGDLDTHDGICRTLARRADCVVVSVDYRLAPEHRFPAACEDSYAATKWVAEHGRELSMHSDRLAIGGDSAGGNLAAVIALLARDRGGPKLRYQLLVYPVTDAVFDTASYVENADGYMLTRDAMRWFWDHYVPDLKDRENPLAAPLRATNLGNLPPALVITAGFDPLRDEGEAYAAKLQAAGVSTKLSRYDGMVHGFFGMEMFIDQAGKAMDEAATALRTALI